MPRPVDRLILVPIRQPVTLYRCTSAQHRHDEPAISLSLTSHYELQRPPRKIEKAFAVLHMAISTWTSFDAAAAMCASYGDRIGHHVAVLDVRPQEGVTIDEPPDPGNEHRSIWGSPALLNGFLVDVRPSW